MNCRLGAGAELASNLRKQTLHLVVLVRGLLVSVYAVLQEYLAYAAS